MTTQAQVAGFSEPPGCRIQVQWTESEGDSEKNQTKEFCGNETHTEEQLLQQAMAFAERDLKPKFNTGQILTISIVKVIGYFDP